MQLHLLNVKISAVSFHWLNPIHCSFPNHCWPSSLLLFLALMLLVCHKCGVGTKSDKIKVFLSHLRLAALTVGGKTTLGGNSMP
jgi:hypothetical protein